MSDFLSQLIRRSASYGQAQPETVLKPRPLSRFEPPPRGAGLEGGLPGMGGAEPGSLEFGEERADASADTPPQISPEGEGERQLRTPPPRPAQIVPPQAGEKAPGSSGPTLTALTAQTAAGAQPGSPPAQDSSVGAAPEETTSPSPGANTIFPRPAQVFPLGETKDAVARAERRLGELAAALTSRLDEFSAAAFESPGKRQPDQAGQPVQARTAPSYQTQAPQGAAASSESWRSETGRPAALQPSVARALPLPSVLPAPEPPAPTIQVTIGRIEVRASAPPPAAPRKPASGPTLSLEDYLRQRNRE